jgi:hypothetical protein
VARAAETPEPFEAAVEPTRDACAGAAASFLLRSIATRAGVYAPGIQDRLFFLLQRERYGRDLDRVEGWFRGFSDELQRLGYRLGLRRVAFRTGGILDWVKGGEGHRGAVLAAHGPSLWPCGEIERDHAVAVTVGDKGGGRSGDRLVVVDPWPGRPRPAKLPETLEAAHRGQKYGSLVVFWSGWS